jgi:hypothetical protein
MIDGVTNSSPFMFGFGRVLVVVRDGVLGAAEARALCQDERVVRLLHARPTIVAVHRVIAAAHRRDLTHAHRRHLRLDLTDVAEPGIGRRVAAVGEGVEENPRQTPPPAQFQAREEVLEQPVHAGVADDAEKMKIRAVLQAIRDGSVELGVLVKLAVADLLGDADGLLVDDPAGADVLVADLAVAHRPLGQADVESAGRDQRRRILRHQAVGDRMLREVDGVGAVPLRERILPPAVADDQDERTLDGGHRVDSFVEARDILGVRAPRRKEGRTAKARRAQRRTAKKMNESFPSRSSSRCPRLRGLFLRAEARMRAKSRRAAAQKIFHTQAKNR